MINTKRSSVRAAEAAIDDDIRAATEAAIIDAVREEMAGNPKHSADQQQQVEAFNTDVKALSRKPWRLKVSP